MIGPEGQEQLAGIGAGGQRRIRAPVRQKRGDAAALGVGIPLRLERHHDGGRPARAAGEHGGTVLRIDQDARRGGRQRGHDLGLERGDVGSLRRCHAAALEGDPKRVAVVAGDQREHAARADPVEAAAPTEVGGSASQPALRQVGAVLPAVGDGVRERLAGAEHAILLDDDPAVVAAS